MRDKLVLFWENFEDYLCCGLLGAIVTLLMTQVLYRYIGGKAIAWSEEVSRFLFLYLVYLAASLATAKNLHIRVTAHLQFMPRFMQIGMLFLTDVIWLIFCIIVVYQGILFLDSMQNRPMISGALMLDMRYVYFAVPFAFTLQSIRLVERWWRILTKRDAVNLPSEEVF